MRYLRNVEDPYAGRLVTLSPTYTTNPHILASSLADLHSWPELAYPNSPPPSDDEHAPGVSGFPGATGLWYSQTIMGNRSGALGIRTSGKRESLRAKKAESRSETSSSATVTVIPATAPSSDVAKPSALKSSSLSGRAESQVDMVSEPDSPKPPEPTPPPPSEKPTQFIPRFKGAAEMEARRRIRMNARAAPAVPTKPATPVYVNPDLTSSEEDSDFGVREDDEDEDEDEDDVDSDFGDVEDDEFDPYVYCSVYRGSHVLQFRRGATHRGF